LCGASRFAVAADEARPLFERPKDASSDGRGGRGKSRGVFRRTRVAFFAYFLGETRK